MSQQQKNTELQKKLKALWSDSRSFGKRFAMAGAAWGAACFTFVFFGPLELVAFSGESLVFRYDQVAWILALAALAAFALGAGVLLLLRGKIFNYAVSVVFALTVGGYLQSAVLNGELGLLTGDGVDWPSFAPAMVTELLLWGLILCGVLFVMYLHRELWRKAVIWISALLMVMQLTPAAMILLGAYDSNHTAGQSQWFLSEKDMYDYSAKDNIFVFVLDRLDYDYIELALKQDPAMLDGLDGFTGYTNAISAYARTKPALAHLLTGDTELAHTVPRREFYREVWQQGDRHILQDLAAADYEISLYSTFNYLFSDADLAKQYVRNASDGKGDLEELTVLRKLLQLSAYRYAPTAMKPFYWADTNYYNSGAYEDADLKAYEFNDAGYAPGFRESTAEGTKNSFKFYHFFGPHAPYTMNADGTAGAEPTTVQAQTIGSFKNLIAAFDRMQELGIYEDATIIITGDHGAAVSDTKPISKETRVGLFYKPSGSAGTPLVSSRAPVSTANIAATIMKAAGADYAPYGRALDEIGEDEQIVRVTYKTISDTTTWKEVELIKYHVTGDASNFNNWEIVSRIPIDNSFYN